jgi:hypothetical protein
MAALHLKSSNWVRQGVFTPLSSFVEFESRINAIPEEKDRGDVFEIFIEGYLATQAIAQSRQHCYGQPLLSQLITAWHN